MAFSKLAFYEITNKNLGAMPTYGTEAIKLYTGILTNNISLEIAPNTASKTRSADDVVETETAETDATATLTVYDVDKDGYNKIMGYKLDDSGSLIQIANPKGKEFGVFFETKDENNDKRIQIYMPLVKISSATTENFTTKNPTEEQRQLTITMDVMYASVKGESIKKIMVYEGDSKFVDTGYPTEFYGEITYPVQS